MHARLIFDYLYLGCLGALMLLIKVLMDRYEQRLQRKQQQRQFYKAWKEKAK